MKMKWIYYGLVAMILFSCQPKDIGKNIAKLNGYWEIDHVVLPDGSKKEYQMNESIDYFEIKSKTGYRKKVMPQFNGKYVVNNQQEDILITEKDAKFFVNYTTKYSKFKEEIIEIEDSVLVLKNDLGYEYFYKKPIPFSLK